eukprot:CAMPEP_0169130200 /NCGR_PEP_ID=MMETSP1015-20121227/37569_1 /TAXON_ID=342587 /ORGANISM="Karlodinium micrum, Strain CCMP2283" /LENGTH=218 /DNA_ID=CAMNT_0009194343 /DNA_START=1 /DNA_END=654 /DNA_ORIENTATION=+
MWRRCCVCGGGKQGNAAWDSAIQVDIGGMIGNVAEVEPKDFKPHAMTWLWVLLWRAGHEDDDPKLYFAKHSSLIDAIDKPEIPDDQVGLQSGMDCRVVAKDASRHDVFDSGSNHAKLIRGLTSARVPNAFWTYLDKDCDKPSSEDRATCADAYRCAEKEKPTNCKDEPKFSELCEGIVKANYKDIRQLSAEEIRAKNEPLWAPGQEVRLEREVKVYPT